MARGDQSGAVEARRVYDLHVKPVEHEHPGEYALVTPDGQTYFAPTLADVMIRAHERPDTRNAIFGVRSVTLGRA